MTLTKWDAYGPPYLVNIDIEGCVTGRQARLPYMPGKRLVKLTALYVDDAEGTSDAE